jgi:hypothetical protein
MNSSTAVDRADLALDAFHELVGRGDSIDDALAHAVRLYPDQADMIAGASTLSQVKGVAIDQSPLGENVDVAMKRVVDRFRPKPLASLRAAMTSAGVSIGDMTSSLRVGTSVLTKLNRRLIDPTTIPVKFLTAVADILGESVERIGAYLALGPTFAVSDDHKHPKTPVIQGQQSFQEAVSECKTADGTSLADIEYWERQ